MQAGDPLNRIRRAMRINRRYLRADIVSGLSSAVAGAPLAMGFALIAGVSPIYGLYTAVVATIVGALTSSSTYMTVGTTNALALVVASSLVGFEGEPRIEALFVLTFLVGVFMFLFGILQLGTLVRFVSNAVMTGFITGAGLLIIFGQVRHINGYNPSAPTVPEQFVEWLGQIDHVPTLVSVDPGIQTALARFIDWIQHLHLSNPQTVAIGLASMATIILIRKTRFKNLATLFAIVMASLTVLALGWDDVALVRDISFIPRGLPVPSIPDIGLVPELATAALAMAVLGAVQSAALTNSIPEPDGSTSDSSRDFIGMGLANILSGVFQGMPACGSLSRTAINVNAGAKTRFSNVFAGLYVALFLLVLGSFIEMVTLAALAAQLILAAISLISPSQIRVVWRVNMSGRIVMIATFVSTLVLPLEFSIYVGVGLALVLYLYTSSQRLRVEQLVPMGDNRYRSQAVNQNLPENDIIIFDVHGHLYFAAVSKLESLLPNPITSHNTFVILRIRSNDYLGSTGIRFLIRYKQMLQSKGGDLLLAGLSPQVHMELVNTGAIRSFGHETVFEATDIYFEATEQALRCAQGLLARRTSISPEMPQ